jgi:Putative transposase
VVSALRVVWVRVAPSTRPLRGADGGRVAPDGARWIHARPRFFLPIPVLRKLFRGKLVAGVRDAFRDGRLDFPGTLERLKIDAAFRAFLRSLYRQTWVVYAKPPFGSPAHVLHYLARYTHRVAISNHRLVDVTDETVSFRWKDYRHGSQRRTLTLTAEEFLRRFLLHVLLKRFVRIRYFGFLASRCRTRGLPVSPGAGRHPNATGRTARRRITTNVVAMSPLRCPHAHRRTADGTTALPSRAPRERHP